MEADNREFRRSLSLLDAIMVVSGVMIGSGIFIVSADMLRNVGTAGWLILLWVITGLMTIIGALSYGELSGMFPHAGGPYVYLREAYGKKMSFLYGWSFFAVIQTGTIAAVGVAFSKFAAYLLPAAGEDHYLVDFVFFKLSAAQLISIFLIVFLSLINTLGVKYGKLIQTVFTLAKLLSLIGLIVFGLAFAKELHVWHANWQHAFRFGRLDTDGFHSYHGLVFVGAFAAAMVGSLFSSDDWYSVAFIAAEVKKPERNIGLSLILGTLIVTVLYILVNIVYLSVLSTKQIAFAFQDRIAIEASFRILGKTGTRVMALLIMISTFGCINGQIMTGARVYHAMANDGLFFRCASKLNKNGVPASGLWIQCLWSCILCLSGHYGDLLNYVIFVVLIFYILNIAGIFRLRRNRPDLYRPYRCFGFPVLPVLYIILASVICIALLFYKPLYTWPGLLIVCLGLPIYSLCFKKTEECL